jgi:hypothetical protein
MTVAQALLQQVIDYAGLFPPAGLDLEAAVRDYASYQTGHDAWALGRFVLPAGKIAEFVDRWPQYVEWPISLLLGVDYDTEMRLAVDSGLKLDVVECRPERLEDIASIRKRMPADAKLFIESPPAVSRLDAIRSIADAGAYAKLRTGGVTADAIPDVSNVTAFLVSCAERGLCFKATAGLHHAIRGEYRLTYAADSPTACMHGFVNFFLAATAAYEGASEARVTSILNDSDRGKFRATANEILWCDETFSVETIQRTRQHFAMSFGSCSFEEPIEEMRSMGWIE